MIYEEHHQMSGRSGGGLCGGGVGVGGSYGGLSRSSKKQKNKKIPQRGLGVAQLEKIRIEEEEAANTIFPTTTKSSTLSASNLVNFPSSPSQIPYPPLPPPPSVSLPLSQGGLCFSFNKGDYRAIPTVEDFHLNSLPTLNPNSIRGFDVDWPSVPPIHGTPRLWNPYDMNHELESNGTRMDQQGLVSGLTVSLPYENSPVGPLPDLMPKPQHFQPSSASLVNLSSIKSLPVINFQMEPPSNQSYLSNLTSFWPDDEKMVFTKRPYPFPFDNLSPPLRSSKLPRIAHPMSGSDESTTSCGNGSCNNLDLIVPVFREVPSLQSITMPESVPRKSNNRESGNSNVDFLSLAPPSIAPTPPSPKHKNSYSNVNVQDTGLKLSPGQGCLSQQHHFFSFMPSRKHQDTIKGVNNYCSENGAKEMILLWRPRGKLSQG